MEWLFLSLFAANHTVMTRSKGATITHNSIQIQDVYEKGPKYETNENASPGFLIYNPSVVSSKVGKKSTALLLSIVTVKSAAAISAFPS